ncbi:MAG: hypothetical protein KDI66_22990, partial [Xanthomonadales bacterium]|nr:hypothetical protein [Xanthomonadales bacterium]
MCALPRSIAVSRISPSFATPSSDLKPSLCPRTSTEFTRRIMDRAFDTAMMARAVQLARLGQFSAMPNPHVGCVLVRDGQIIGEGYTRPAGGSHAEIVALEA